MAKKLLELKNVSRTFLQGGETIHALQETNFSIMAGEFVAIIGPSGSGKSTFLTIAGGLQTPTSGSVIIDGTDITKMNAKKLSRIRFDSVGFILQASNLVPFLTVNQQLELRNHVAGTPVDKKLQKELFTKLDIAKLVKKYPGELSGGERQRVAIAKVLYGDPKLILADEPTASLDTTKAYEVVGLLARETRERGKATIMVTHDERLVKYCDHIYEMHDGELKQRS